MFSGEVQIIVPARFDIFKAHRLKKKVNDLPLKKQENPLRAKAEKLVEQ